MLSRAKIPKEGHARMSDETLDSMHVGSIEGSDEILNSSLPRAAPLASRIYEDLLQDIAMNRFEDGQKLPSEAALCERFGVSRPVLREALTRLKADGLIVARQGSGSFVRRPRNITLQAGASMNVADIIRSLEFRMAVEAEATYLAAKRRSEKDIENIAVASEEFDRITSAREVGINSDFRFHLSIAIASRNDLFVSSLWRIHRTIGHELTLINLRATKSAARKKEVKEEHHRIWAAIRDGDAKVAAETARRHVEIALERIIALTEGK
jgi:GntR family transcriptional regulator, transcriptional repressor for pyruvate dehydrogenase complex